jgi:hypothetical protein
MLRIIARSKIALCAISLALTSVAYAKDAALLHPGPWPIWNWHNHQPRQDQLNAMHERDVTPEESREVDRLYMQLEQRAPTVRGKPLKSR